MYGKIYMIRPLVLFKKHKKCLQSRECGYIIIELVTLIAMKREVAAGYPQVFRGANVKLENWRQVTVQS